MNSDTIKLLNECDAGVKMGISSLKEVIPYIKDTHLKSLIASSIATHTAIENDITDLLSEYNDSGKEPNPMAKSMSFIKIKSKLALTDKPDATVASLITDGCNMGVKSLNKYINQYPSANYKVCNVAEKIIASENNLVNDLKNYLI